MTDENWFKLILNSMRDMVLVKGPESRLLWANKAFLDYYGMTEEELRGIVDGPQSDPDDTLQYVRDDKYVFDHQKNLNIPSEPVTSSKGETRYFHTIKSPIFENGKMIEMVGVSRFIEDEDIDQQELSQLDAKVFAAPLRKIIDTFPIKTMLLDHNMRIVSCNARWIEAFGDLKGSTNSSLNDEFENLSLLREVVRESLSTQAESEIDIELKIDKHKMYFDFKVSPWMYPNGSLGGVIVIATDVTNIRENESLISTKKKEQEMLSQRHILALEASRVGVWEWDLVSNELVWDKHMYALYGIKEEDFEGAYFAWEKGLHPEDKENAVKEIDDAIANKEKFNAEFRVIWPNGNIRNIRALADVILDGSGEAVKMIGVNWDITEQKDREKLILKSNELLHIEKEKALLAEKAKTRFLANMSHEIRTPLNGLIGMSELLEETSLNEEQSQMLRNIKASADTLIHIVNDILDLSKIESGKIELERIPFSIGQLVDFVVSSTKLLLAKNGNRLGINYGGLEKSFYLGDPNRIKQVLTNLVSNAAKFTEDGEIEIGVSEFESNSQKFIKVAVQDSGIGLSADEKDRVFQNFTQADSSTQRKYGGTGLGLSISKELCQLMGGKISVESEEGKGATFWFEIPLDVYHATDAELSASEEVAGSDADLGYLKVLVAEDNEINQNIVVSHLKKYNIKPLVAKNGLEAIKHFENNSLDLIFMDIQMPDMDGIEATKKIRETKAGQEVYIVALTANAFEEDKKLCLEIGMDDFLTKPIKRESLREFLLKYSRERSTRKKE